MVFGCVGALDRSGLRCHGRISSILDCIAFCQRMGRNNRYAWSHAWPGPGLGLARAAKGQPSMQGPLPIIALVYASGIVCGHYVNVPLRWLFGAAFAVALLTISHRPSRAVAIWPLILLCGWAGLESRVAVLSPYDLRSSFGQTAEYVTLRGHLCETPVRRVFERDDELAWRSIAQVRLVELGRKDEWQRAYGRVAVSTPGVLSERFFAGQMIEVKGVLREPKGPVAEGLFDYQAYLRSLGIYYQLKVESTNDWRVITSRASPKAPPWSDRFGAWAQKTLSKGLPVEDESLRLLWAMTLGWKTALTQEVSEPFMRSGTLHIFAISGLHIALIAGIVVSVLRVAQLPRSVCGLIVIPLLWAYTAATGWQSSAIRSTIMMSVITAGWALNRPSDLVNSLSAAGLIILVWEPRQLLQAGFQLSFFVVLSIALLLPPLRAIQERILKPDPLLPEELRPRWQRSLDAPLRYLTSSFATSLAAWLGSLPLIAYYFYLITPVSLLANLLIVPISSLALMASLGSLCCGDWFLPLTELFNHSAWFWMKMMIRLSERAAALPMAYFYTPPPSILLCFGYYALLGACLSGWLFTSKRRIWIGVAVGIIAVICISIRVSNSPALRLTILPLGGGGLWADVPGRADDLLIDCGSPNTAEFLVKPFLRAQGVNQVPHVLLTHGDLQHIGGMECLDFPISQVTTSSIRFRSAAYRRLIHDLENRRDGWRQANRGESLVGWSILHPDARDHFSQADDNAIVLSGEFGGLRVLLLSDLGKPGQRKLLEREPKIRADVVVTGLPSQEEPLCQDLIEVLRPKVIVIASAEFPAGAHANRKLRDRLARLQVPVIYTGDVGAVTLTIQQRKCELRNAKGEMLSYNYKQVP